MTAMYLVLIVLLAAMLWMLHAALSQSKGGKHRGPRRYRPSGDLLLDASRNDEPLEPLPHATLQGPKRRVYEGRRYTAADLPTVQWDPRLPAPRVPVEPTGDEIERIVQRVREEACDD